MPLAAAVLAGGALSLGPIGRLSGREQPNWQPVRLRTRRCGEGAFGGERKIDAARAYGYRDGSAITQMLKRLQKEARSKPDMAERTSRIEAEIPPKELKTWMNLSRIVA